MDKNSISIYIYILHIYVYSYYYYYIYYICIYIYISLRILRPVMAQLCFRGKRHIPQDKNAGKHGPRELPWGVCFLVGKMMIYKNI